jgi:hypothetical protein
MVFVLTAYFWWALACEPLFLMGRRFLLDRVKDILAADLRSPVLYLRNFAAEGTVGREERAFAYMFGDVGPFIALGRPNEIAPQLGAYRIYVSHADWQGTISHILDRQPILVIMLAGGSAGLGWEMQECKRRLKPSQLAVIVSNDQSEYERFSQAMNDHMNIDLKGIDVDFSEQRTVGFSPWKRGEFFMTPSLRGLITFSEGWAPSFIPLYESSDPSSTAEWKIKLTNAFNSMIQAPVRGVPGDVRDVVGWTVMTGHAIRLLITLTSLAVALIFYALSFIIK